MRSAKDLAKRLRFDRAPRPNAFRRRYFVAALAAAAIGVGLWAAFGSGVGRRQYLPGTVSQNHATFGDRCERCHDAFRTVSNDACQKCHAPRVHSEFEERTPPCDECHVEHRGAEVFLNVSSRSCVHCHGALATKRPAPVLQTSVVDFAGHPRFAPLRDGQRDASVLRFNHNLHLTSEKVSRTEKLKCATCHVAAPDGKLMQPISFEAHCKRCHEQKVQGPTDAIEAPHKTPDIVRASVIGQLLTAGVQNADAIFKGQDILLPGRVRGPIDQSATLREYEDKWLGKVEAALYQPFDDRPPLLEQNKYCFLCHDPDGAPTAGALPVVKETKIPKRWLVRGEFSHRRHDLVSCQTCHAAAEQSKLTGDVNLPRNEVCTACHADGRAQSAGTACMLCHLYHDTSRSPAKRAEVTKPVSLDFLTGKADQP